MTDARDWFAPGGWAWALLRLLAFTLGFALLLYTLGAVWALLPIPATGPGAFLGSAVTAAAALLAGALLIRTADGRSPAALGVAVSRTAVRQSVLGLAIGAAGLAAATVAMLVTGALTYSAESGSVGGWIEAVAVQGAVFAVAAFAEEVLFRGYAFQVVARAWGGAAAVVLTSALFAYAHGANPEVGVFALVNIFLAGILLGVAYLRTLSLWFVTALHLGWNWAMATLFDLPVSGIAVFDTPFYEPAVGGPAWWSGAAFGPEGGLVGTLGFAIALAAVLRLRGVHVDEKIAAARPLMLKTDGMGAG